MAFFSRHLLISLCTLTLAIMVGCDGGDKDSGNIAAPGSVPNTYSALYTQIFGSTATTGCSNGECHSGSGFEGGPNFRDKSSFYTAITTKKMTELNWREVSINCENFKLIEPNDPTKSLIVGTVVIEKDPNDVFEGNGCGPARPNHALIGNGEVLLQGDKAKGLVEWIKAGAPNN